MKLMLSTIALAFAASTVCAEGLEKSNEASDAASASEVKKVAPKVSFSTLPLCRLIEGKVEVRKPGAEWADAEEGKFYPLGSSYRTGKDSRMILAFGAESTVTLAGDSEFATRPQMIGKVVRTIVLVRGNIDLKLPDGIPEGSFFVTAPGFTVKNPAGASRYAYEAKGDGDKVVVRCVTGSLGIEGRHFDIPAMHSADEIIIRTSHDHLSTFLYGTSGDYKVMVDQGLRKKKIVDDEGQLKTTIEKGVLEWHLTPDTKLIINRALPSVGERMSVHTMAFDAAGLRKSECYFCEGRAEVNSGELVAKEKVSNEELAKRAAEATETTEATDAEEPSDAEAASEESSN